MTTCQECKGTKRVREKDGSIRPCWKCLLEGEMDQHSEKLPDTKIRW